MRCRPAADRWQGCKRVCRSNPTGLHRRRIQAEFQNRSRPATDTALEAASTCGGREYRNSPHADNAEWHFPGPERRYSYVRLLRPEVRVQMHFVPGGKCAVRIWRAETVRKGRNARGIGKCRWHSCGKYHTCGRILRKSGACVRRIFLPADNCVRISVRRKCAEHTVHVPPGGSRPWRNLQTRRICGRIPGKTGACVRRIFPPEDNGAQISACRKRAKRPVRKVYSSCGYPGGKRRWSCFQMNRSGWRHCHISKNKGDFHNGSEHRRTSGKNRYALSWLWFPCLHPYSIISLHFCKN